MHYQLLYERLDLRNEFISIYNSIDVEEFCDLFGAYYLSSDAEFFIYLYGSKNKLYNNTKKTINSLYIHYSFIAYAVSEESCKIKVRII